MKIYLDENKISSKIYIRIVFDKFIEEFKNESVYKLYNIAYTDRGPQMNCYLSNKEKYKPLKEIDLNKLTFDEMKEVIKQIKLILDEYNLPFMQKELFEYFDKISVISKKKKYILTRSLELKKEMILNKNKLSEISKKEVINNWSDLIVKNTDNKFKLFLEYTDSSVYCLENGFKIIQHYPHNFFILRKYKEYEVLFNEKILENLHKFSFSNFLKKFEKEKEKSLKNKKVYTTLFQLIFFKEQIMQNLQEIEKHIEI